MKAETNESKQVQKLVANESDVGGVLILTSYIDSCLESVLRTRLKEGSTTNNLLKSGSGPIGTLSGKLDLCYSLEIILKERFSDLKSVAQIRNIFAHNHLTASFENESVSKLCSELNTPEEYLDSCESEDDRSQLDTFFKSPKERFKCTVFSAIDFLVKERIAIVSREGNRERNV